MLDDSTLTYPTLSSEPIMPAKKVTTSRLAATLKKVDAQYVVNVKELQSILNRLGSSFRGYGSDPNPYRSPRLRSLQDAAEKAQQAVDDYEESKTLSNLRKAAQKATKAASDLSDEEDRLRRKDVQAVRNALSIKGPAPEVISAIIKLVEKYEGPMPK